MRACEQAAAPAAAGYINGFGGKVERGETIAAAAARELQEEAGLYVALPDLHHCGILHFEWDDRPQPWVGAGVWDRNCEDGGLAVFF